MACTDWGVRPRWPITGISAPTRASIMGTRRWPPSSFTASAPPSLTNRPALRRVSSFEMWKLSHGMSTITRGRGSARRSGVEDHDVDVDAQRVAHSVDHVGDRVPDEDHVHAGVGSHTGGWIVVGGDHRELRPALAGPYVGDGDLVTHEDSSLPTAPG